MIAALTSGGKDSILAIHKVPCDLLIGVYPKREDSYMFHTVNLHVLDATARCLDMPLVKIEVSGEEEKEVFELESEISKLEIDAICIGAIASNYQFSRMEKICKNLGIKLIAPLWNKDEEKLLEEIAMEFEAIIVSVSAMGLDESFLGRKIDERCLEDLRKIREKFGINVAGEGGEYESLVLDAPLFKKKIAIKDAVKHWKNFYGFLEIKNYELKEKFRKN